MAKASKSTFERLTAKNRKQRRKLQQQLCSADPGLAVVHPNAAGIDVGNESHYVAVPADREGAPVQEFGCWTADMMGRPSGWDVRRLGREEIQFDAQRHGAQYSESS